MDPTNCPFGLATDRIFQDYTPICGSSLIAYWATTMFLIFIRVIASWKRSIEWYHSYKKGKHKGFPKAAAISCSATLFYFLAFFLSGLNILNVHNGGSFAMYSLAFLPYSLDFSLFLLRVVKQGHKIIPIGLDVQEINSLEKFETIGMILFSFQLMSVFVSCLVLVVISPILPIDYLILGSIGWGTKSGFMILTNIGIFYQFERVIRAIKKFNPVISHETHHLITEKAIKRLRARQFSPMFFFGNFVAIVYLLLAVSALPWIWEWIYISTAGAETVGILILEFFFKKKSSIKTENTPLTNTPAINLPISPVVPPPPPADEILQPSNKTGTQQVGVIVTAVSSESNEN